MCLRRFELRRGSGGVGAFAGGDGVVRELAFLRPLTVSILSERRVYEPFGLAGGGPGARGYNLLVRADGRRVNLGGKNTVEVRRGDCLVLHTPGGGGYGPPGAPAASAAPTALPTATLQERGSVAEYTRRQEASA